ncbi:SGNH/GDSL hydrolase family protein [Euzebya rosea]|uniref:SGNH/GDSL hydrolase family protein n=1 Tax=Euzebya rosea TaxID=2052804 RepID=UPI000D3E5F8C|nr:SGNH/GDSL hydrolase family protein [Euzebya rosea]
MSYRRFVALGDSLTEGKGDAYPNGELRGFADMVAHGLRATVPDVVYANLARPSVRAHEIRRDQAPQAAAMAPDLVTAVAGINDVIALAFPRRRVHDEVLALFEDLRRALPDATIVTCTLPDLGHLSAVARLWRGRVRVLNESARAAARAQDLVLVDLEDDLPMTAEELALDRVHPSPLGHLRFARRFARALDVPQPDPSYLARRPRAERLYRLYRTAVVAPRFVTKRVARDTLIAGQPPKRPQLELV